MTDEVEQPIGAVDRVLSVLELLAQEVDVGLSDVRNHLGVSQSTAHRLMAALVQRGYAGQGSTSRTYRAGPALFELGRAPSDVNSVAQIVRPVLEWLAEASGETAHLGTLTGVNVRHVDVVASSAPLRVAGRIGRLSPAHATSLGKAMLATMDDATVLAMYADRVLGQETKRTITNLRALCADLARTRTRGWARSREELQLGVCSVAVSLVHPTGVLLGALSLAVPKARSSTEIELRHVGLLQEAVERAFAWRPEDGAGQSARPGSASS